MVEEKPEGTPDEPENTPELDSQPEGTPPETKPEEENWEQRYKDLQSETTPKLQRLADFEREAEQPPVEPTEDEDDEGEFVDKKTVKQIVDSAVSQAVSSVRKESANRYFRKTYPDLVRYENAIAGIMRSPKVPVKKGTSFEERIDAAVKEYNEQTEEQKTAAAAKAEADAKEREEKNRKAAGLGGPTTPPPKGDEEGESDEDEIKRRKAQQAKRRNF